MTAVGRVAGSVEAPTAPPPARSRDRTGTLLRPDWWPAAVPVLLLAVQGWQRRWMADDGFIHLRVVENVLAGNGFVFNAGERVEASTSALWVALLAVLGLPHLVGLEMLAVVTGLLCAVGGLVLAILGAAILWRRPGERVRLLPVGATVVAVLPPVWDFATSGLEVGLVFLWLGGPFFLLARLTVESTAGWRPFRVVALVVGAGPLIRPDLALFTGAFLLVTLVLASRAHPRPRRQLAILVALGAALPCAYQVYRMGYYAALVPNTALAKEASQVWWSQGWRYMRDFLRPYWLLFPLVMALGLLAVGVGRWVRERAVDRLLVAVAPVAGGLADALYVTRVGGDFMHGRLLLPGLFAVLMPVAVVGARTWWRTTGALLVLPWAVVCAAEFRVPYVVGPEGITDERAFYTITAEDRNPVRVGDYARSILYHDGRAARQLDRLPDRRLGWRTDATEPRYTSAPLRPGLPSDTAFIASNLGITGVLAGPEIHIVDPSGLADPIASRILLTARGRPGHEKALPLPWAVARFGDPASPVPDGVSPPAVDAARRALGCGPLRDLRGATTDRLTFSRFLRNMALAIRLRDFRLPSDPLAAEARFCGR